MIEMGKPSVLQTTKFILLANECPEKAAELSQTAS